MTTQDLDNKGTRKALGDELGEHLKKRYDQLKTAASRLGIRYQQLRQDLSKNRYHEKDLLDICLKSDFPYTSIAALKKHFDFELREGSRGTRRVENEFAEKLGAGECNIGDFFLSMSSRMSFVYQNLQTGKQVIPKMFQCLGSQDSLVLFLSDQRPTHWDRTTGAAWIPEILKKLNDGARIIYLYPTDNLVKTIAGNGYPGMYSESQVQNWFGMFKGDLQRACPPDYDVEKILNHVHCMCHNSPIICVPQHRYILFSYLGDTNSCPDVCACARFPIIEQTGIAMEPGDFPAFPLSRAFTKILLDVSINAVEQFIKPSTGQQHGLQQAEVSDLNDFLMTVSAGYQKKRIQGIKSSPKPKKR